MLVPPRRLWRAPPVTVDDTMSPEVLHLTQYAAQRRQPSGESVVFGWSAPRSRTASHWSL